MKTKMDKRIKPLFDKYIRSKFYMRGMLGLIRVYTKQLMNGIVKMS